MKPKRVERSLTWRRIRKVRREGTWRTSRTWCGSREKRERHVEPVPTDLTRRRFLTVLGAGSAALAAGSVGTPTMGVAMDLADPEAEVEIELANGEEKGPLVRVRIRAARRPLGTKVTVTDRSELSKDMLIGGREFDGF